MPGRPSTPKPPRPLVAALQPEPRGRLDRALRTSAAGLAGLGAGAALLGFSVARLRTRIEITHAIRRGQDAMGEGIVLIDPPTLRVVHATPAAAALFGRPPAEFHGFDLLDALRPEDRRI